jgi:hypothetical protein
MQARENKFPYVVLIVQLIWLSYAVLVCDWLFFFKSYLIPVGQLHRSIIIHVIDLSVNIIIAK